MTGDRVMVPGSHHWIPSHPRISLRSVFPGTVDGPPDGRAGSYFLRSESSNASALGELAPTSISWVTGA